MSDAQWIWRFGRWVAERPHGSATLSWSGGSLTLKVAAGRVVGVEGLDVGSIPGASGSPDVLQEAVATARRRGLPETEGVAAVKEALEEALDGWFSDPERKLDTIEEAPPQATGPTISLSHAIVEGILVRGGDELPRAILPDLQVMLRRAPGFLERYASLQLSEEADLIAAKITGQRTAEQIIQRTPHDREEVFRLLAALVAAGLLEPVPVATPEEDLADDILFTAPTMEGTNARRLPVRWIIAGALVLLAILAGTAVLLSRAGKTSESPPRAWGVVVDRGCEPQDLQRILNKAGRFPDSVRAERTDAGQGEPCWELIWGHFNSREEALKALPNAPRTLRHDGIDPKVVPLEEVPETRADGKEADGAEH